MIVRKLEEKDIPEAIILIRESYDRFVSHDYTPEGTHHFYEYASVEALEARIQGDSHFALVAVNDGEMIGIIEMRNCDHCSMFFVKAKHHGQGIGRWLFEEAIEICRAHFPGLKEITVHSSPYAVPVYRKLGFISTDTLREENGIIYQPMRCTL